MLRMGAQQTALRSPVLLAWSSRSIQQLPALATHFVHHFTALPSVSHRSTAASVLRQQPSCDFIPFDRPVISKRTPQKSAQKPTQRGWRSREPTRQSVSRGPKSKKKEVVQPSKAKMATRKAEKQLESVGSDLPTEEELPHHLPPNFFGQAHTYLVTGFRQSPSWGAYQMNVKTDMLTGAGKPSTHHATATVSFPNGNTLLANAWATNKVRAQNTAAAHLLAQIHKANPDLSERMCPEIVVRHRREKQSNTILDDVYEYCVSHHLDVPDVRIEKSLTLSSKSIWRCAIKFENASKSISVEGRGFAIEAKTAVAVAGQQFKAAVESNHATSSPEQGDVSAVLTGDTSQKFFEYLDVRSAKRFGWSAPEIKCKLHPQIKEFWTAQAIRQESSASAKAGGADKTASGDEVLGPQVLGRTKAIAAKHAWMAAATHIIQTSNMDVAGVLTGFRKNLEQGQGRVLRPPRPVGVELSRQSLCIMRDTMKEARALTPSSKRGLDEPRRARENEASQDGEAGFGTRSRFDLSPPMRKATSHALAAAYERYLTSPETKAMRKTKEELPMTRYAAEVYDLVHNHVFSIIVGATGSGKTTQVPQIILDRHYREGRAGDCNILCTQPRRIAATSVAQRVSDEMVLPELRQRIGHHVRFDARLPRPGGSLTYCTTGILLQQLQNEPEKLLEHTSHIVLDEVHERDKIVDFTLTMLKRAVMDRLSAGKKVPRVTLMSATLDTELFAGYLKNIGPDGQEVGAPVLQVPGRTFPVAEQHLDDIMRDLRRKYPQPQLALLQRDQPTAQYLESEQSFARGQGGRAQASGEEERALVNWRRQKEILGAVGDEVQNAAIVPIGLVATTIAHVLRTTEEGAIMVFLPGLEEMQKVHKLIQDGPILGLDLTDESRYRVYMLHSSIPDAQQTVFADVGPGLRKIILSTNIGETSITIPDVRHVVDTGKVRETHYDHATRVSALQTRWISRSNAKQRAGRAGRVQQGHYLALYTAERRDSMRVVGLPELLRSDLQTTILDIKASLPNTNVADFLAAAIEPPSVESVKEAIKQLTELGAIETCAHSVGNLRLTQLGKLLSQLPVHPALGKMIVLGILFKCLDPIMVVGAAAEERGLFVTAPEVKRESMANKREYGRDTMSDHLAVYFAFDSLRKIYTPGASEAGSWVKQLAFDRKLHFGCFRTIYGACQEMEQILANAGLIPLQPAPDERPEEYFDPYRAFNKLARTRRSAPAERSRLFGGEAFNTNSSKPHIVKAILMAGMQPNLAIVPDGNYSKPMRTELEPFARLPSTSVLVAHHAQRELDVGEGRENEVRERRENALVTYTNLVKSVDGKSVFLRDATTISPLAVTLFSSRLTVEPGAYTMLMNGWVPVFLRSVEGPRTVDLVLRFRGLVDEMLAGVFKDLSDPRMGSNETRYGKTATEKGRERVVEGVVGVLDADAGLLPAIFEKHRHVKSGSEAWEARWARYSEGRNDFGMSRCGRRDLRTSRPGSDESRPPPAQLSRPPSADSGLRNRLRWR